MALSAVSKISSFKVNAFCLYWTLYFQHNTLANLIIVFEKSLKLWYGKTGPCIFNQASFSYNGFQGAAWFNTVSLQDAHTSFSSVPVGIFGQWMLLWLHYVFAVSSGLSSSCIRHYLRLQWSVPRRIQECLKSDTLSQCILVVGFCIYSTKPSLISKSYFESDGKSDTVTPGRVFGIRHVFVVWNSSRCVN